MLEQITEFCCCHPTKKAEELSQQLREFFLQRIRTSCKKNGLLTDLVNAVAGEDDPEYGLRALRDLLDVRDRALFLQKINNGTLTKIYETVNRSTRLAAQGDLDTTQLNGCCSASRTIPKTLRASFL